MGGDQEGGGPPTSGRGYFQETRVGNFTLEEAKLPAALSGDQRTKKEIFLLFLALLCLSFLILKKAGQIRDCTQEKSS